MKGCPMENEKMVELFGIDAAAVGEKDYPLGTEVRAFPNGDQLVARVNNEVVASFSKRYINSLKAESEKRILLGARTGDTIRLSVQVPAMRAILANAYGSISGSNGSYRIEKDKIIYHDNESDDTQVRPIVSASAKIESGEDLKQRVTATRLFFFGVFAFALKKSSGGEKFLTLEGEDFFWAIEIPNENTNEAMRFVAKVNSLAKAIKVATAKPVRGLVESDGRLHTAVVSVSGSVFGEEDGVNAALSECLDAKISEIANAGHEIVSVAPLSCVESAMSVLVTYK